MQLDIQQSLDHLTIQGWTVQLTVTTGGLVDVLAFNSGEGLGVFQLSDQPSLAHALDELQDEAQIRLTTIERLKANGHQ